MTSILYLKYLYTRYGLSYRNSRIKSTQSCLSLIRSLRAYPEKRSCCFTKNLTSAIMIYCSLVYKYSTFFLVNLQGEFSCARQNREPGEMDRLDQSRLN